MGLAVLPARLKNEMDELAAYILEGKDIRSNETIEKHADWVETFRDQYTFTEENVEDIFFFDVMQLCMRMIYTQRAFFRGDIVTQCQIQLIFAITHTRDRCDRGNGACGTSGPSEK